MMEKKFDEDTFKAAVNDLKPTDGSDWDDAMRNMFAQEIFRSRKNMNAVAQKMNVPMKTCLAYYLGTFKASDSYRLLKTVCCEERLERLEDLEHGLDACNICGDGGSLLICDGCEKEYHMACLRPRLASVPDGDWECDECIAIKFLEAKEFVLRRTRLFMQEQSRKRSLEESEEGTGDEVSGKLSLRPADTVLEAARLFAKAGSAALSKSLASIEGGKTYG
jgi:hypothetical protein